MASEPTQHYSAVNSNRNSPHGRFSAARPAGPACQGRAPLTAAWRATVRPLAFGTFAFPLIAPVILQDCAVGAA